jgi:hypothetical protein
MNETHEVISAFLDNESFDLRDLAVALEEPAGRAKLIDLIALRQIVEPARPLGSVTVRRAGRYVSFRLVAAAAIVVGALVGGYAIGERQAAGDPEAPAPARVIEATAAWRTHPTGGMQ